MLRYRLNLYAGDFARISVIKALKELVIAIERKPCSFKLLWFFIIKY